MRSANRRSRRSGHEWFDVEREQADAAEYRVRPTGSGRQSSRVGQTRRRGMSASQLFPDFEREQVRRRRAARLANSRFADRRNEAGPAVVIVRMSDIQITINTTPQPRARWFILDRSGDETTDAMNTNGGVIVRTRVDAFDNSVAVSMVAIDGTCVAQRWVLTMVDADPSEGTEGHALLFIDLGLANRADIVFGELRWRPAGDRVVGPWMIAGQAMIAPSDAVLRELIITLRTMALAKQGSGE
jgi:hypothetical protein